MDYDYHAAYDDNTLQRFLFVPENLLFALPVHTPPKVLALLHQQNAIELGGNKQINPEYDELEKPVVRVVRVASLVKDKKANWSHKFAADIV